MSQIFSPRTTTRPTAPEPILSSPKVQTRKHVAVWQQWKPRLIMIAQWLIRQLKQISKLVTRYVLGLSRTQRIQHVAIIFGVIVLIFAFGQIFSRHSISTQTTRTDGGVVQLPKESPSFSTILPSGKSVSDYGGWTRVSPSDRNPSYVYADRITGVVIRVNEQQLPDTFKADPEAALKQLTDQLGAMHALSVDGTTVYLGKNAKGPQTLIFIKRDLLINITSDATIDDQKWIDYIKSLR